MAWSRSTRIKALLVVDGLFFLIEIIVGYAVGSLALVADSFHMLNDVCSLVVALYAIKLASSRNASEHYSYGWQRAEVLGALINGVFLLALCFSIFMEAIERFFSTTEVSNPRLIVIVGACGLASNIVGLILFHDHGNSHDGGFGHSHSHSLSHLHVEAPKLPTRPIGLPRAVLDERTPLISASAPANVTSSSRSSNTSSSGYEDSLNPLEDIFVHPAQARDNVIRAAELAGYGSVQTTEDNCHSSQDNGNDCRARSWSTHTSFGNAVRSKYERNRRGSAPAKPKSDPEGSYSHIHTHKHTEGDGHIHSHDYANGKSYDHEDSHSHSHSHGAGDGHGSHSHRSMNMQGVLLHVLGDALGNVGVIAAGLLIWLTTWSGRFYFDPLISLVITIIIFSSALPLVRSASFILLQGTPHHVSLGRVRKTILEIPGVRSVHELHIWSLSESKLVASVHVLVGSQEEYAPVSREIRKQLHQFGVHSSTIQPEILGSPSTSLRTDIAKGYIPSAMVDNCTPDEAGCLVQCTDLCGEEACCPPASRADSLPAATDIEVGTAANEGFHIQH